MKKNLIGFALLASMGSMSLTAWGASWPVGNLICEADPDGVELEIMNEHVLRLRTPAVEDEYYRVVTTDAKRLTAEHVFDADKAKVGDTETTAVQSGRSLTLLRKGKVTELRISDRDSKIAPASYICKLPLL